jgi:hypothetical protein
VGTVRVDLYWHERERVEKEGDLGPLGEDAPESLRTAVLQLLSAFGSVVRSWEPAHSRLQQLFGTLKPAVTVPGWHVNPYWEAIADWVRRCSRDELLTTLEVVAHVNPDLLRIWSASRGRFPDELNALFVHHRFGFEMSKDGRIRRIGSPLLQEELIRPALLRFQDSRLGKAQDHYHQALHHYRGGEARRCIFEAVTALEGTLKALGYKGDRLDRLAEDFRKRAPARGYITDTLGQLESLMKDLYGLRSDRGAHAAEPTEDEVPLAYALLALHCQRPLRAARGRS